VLSQVTALLTAGDSWNALVVLEAITDECMDELASLYEQEVLVETAFTHLGELWTEALLTADLMPDEREEWAGELAEWRESAGDCDLGDGLEMAQAAAEQGWDYPPLQRVLQGEITEKGAWEDESPSFADDLAVIRLGILARQKRFQEYLNLAEAEGQTDLYITMLVQAGRAAEAVAYGMESVTTVTAAMALSMALQAQGLIADALRIGEHGLGLAGAKQGLAHWLRDTAASAGQAALALQAAVVAFREMPSLAEYKAVQAVAGEQWPSLRSDLIDHLRQTPTVWGSNSVDIFLYEGLIDDAIAIVDARSYYGNIVTVIDAAYRTHPDWAIGACRRWAEPIMDGNKAKHYDDAARWVEKIRTIYRAAGREAEWQAYLSELLGRHARQYKLVPMLQALRK
jgi:uncharacterized Zn finger protein